VLWKIKKRYESPPPLSSPSREETPTLILPLRGAEGEDIGGGAEICFA